MSTNSITQANRTSRTAWLQSISYYCAFIGLGLSGAILGPTLTQLSTHTGSTLSTISLLFSANAFGRLFGGLFGGRLFDRLPGHPTMGSALLLMALALTLIPITPILAILLVFEAMLGLAEGTIDVGSNTLLLWVHGNRVGPFMNALHFMFGVGSFITPFIVVSSLTRTLDVRQAYWIVAAIMVPLAIFVLSQPSPHTQHTPTTIPNAISDSGIAKPNQTLIIVLIIVFFYLIVAGEGSVFSWIFNFGKALNLGDGSIGSTDAVAGQLSQVFFGSFTIGRLLSIPLATRVSPRMMLLVNCIGSLVACVLIGIGVTLPVLAWIGTGIFGLCIAPLFACTLSFAEQHIKITGRITGFFLASANFGIMTVPPLIGQFFESAGPISMPIAVGAAMVLSIAVFIAILFITDKRLLQTRH